MHKQRCNDYTTEEIDLIIKQMAALNGRKIPHAIYAELAKSMNYRHTIASLAYKASTLRMAQKIVTPPPASPEQQKQEPLPLERYLADPFKLLDEIHKATKFLADMAEKAVELIIASEDTEKLKLRIAELEGIIRNVATATSSAGMGGKA